MPPRPPLRVGRPPLLALAGLGGALGACRSSPGDSAEGPEAGCRTCEIRDVHNLGLDLRLSVETQALAAGSDAALRWTALDRDLFGRPLDPLGEIRSATLYLFHDIEPQQILDELGQNVLQQGAVSAFWTCPPAEGGCSLSDFSLVGHPLIPATDFDASLGPWLLVLSSGSAGGIRSLSFLEPSLDSEQHELSVTADSAVAAVTSDLASVPPLGLASGADIVLDWSGLSTDSWGRPLEATRLDRLRLDRLDLGPKELGARLPELAALSLESWQAPLTGDTALDLAQLVGERQFDGLDTESTWLATAWCDTCLFELPPIGLLLERVPTPPQGVRVGMREAYNSHQP